MSCIVVCITHFTAIIITVNYYVVDQTKDYKLGRTYITQKKYEKFIKKLQSENIEQKQFCQFRLVWENNINMDFKATELEVVKWIHLAQNESSGKMRKKNVMKV